MKRLWEVSSSDGAVGVKGWFRRARSMALAWRYRSALRPILEAPPGSLLRRIADQRSGVYGFTRAPYLLANWAPPRRFAEYAAHVEAADSLGPLMNFDPDLSVELMALDAIEPGYHLVLDKPEWMFREGIVTFNLFKDNLRLFSLTFSFDRGNNALTAIIGGLQGRNLPGILDEYRAVTKAAHGLRPRDLMVELFRLFCAANGVMRILAVSNSGRIHQGDMFKTKHYASLDYDEAWLDRGGTPIDANFFDLPLRREIREEVPQKKRTMYRKRYELLDGLEERMIVACSSPRVVRRAQAE